MNKFALIVVATLAFFALRVESSLNVANCRLIREDNGTNTPSCLKDAKGMIDIIFPTNTYKSRFLAAWALFIIVLITFPLANLIRCCCCGTWKYRPGNSSCDKVCCADDGVIISRSQVPKRLSKVGGDVVGFLRALEEPSTQFRKNGGHLEPDHFFVPWSVFDEYFEPQDIAKLYTRTEVMTSKVAMGIPLLFAGLAIIIMPNGAVLFTSGINNVLGSAGAFGNYLLARMESVKNFLRVRDYKGNLVEPPQYIGPPSLFNDTDPKSFKVMITSSVDSVNSKQEKMKPITKVVKPASLIVSAIPLGFWVLMFLLTICSVRNYGPCSLLWLIWIVACIALLLLGVSATTWTLFSHVCDEVENQLACEPESLDGNYTYTVYASSCNKQAFFQLEFLPLCRKTMSFDAIVTQVQQAEKDQAFEACKFLLEVCTSNPTPIVFSAGNQALGDEKIFNCKESDLQDKNVCNGVAFLVTQLDAITMRVIDPYTYPPVPPSPPGTPTLPALPLIVTSGRPCGSDVPNNECSLRRCADLCTPENLGKTDGDDSTRKSLQLFVTAMTMADNALKAARQEVFPLLNCDKLLNAWLVNIDKCRNLVKGSEQIYTGCLLMGLSFVLGVPVVWMGGKRWWSLDEVTETDVENTKEHLPTRDTTAYRQQQEVPPFDTHNPAL